MKKLLLLLLLCTETVNYSSNLCFGRDSNSITGRRFRKYAPEKIQCGCNCQSQLRSSHEQHYECLKCGHRLLPAQLPSEKTTFNFNEPKLITEWNQRELKRFYEKEEKDELYLLDELDSVNQII